MHIQKSHRNLTWAAGGSSQLFFDDLPQRVLNAWAHVHTIYLKLALTVTAHAANDTPGELVCRAIDQIIIKDRSGNPIYRLKGHMLRTAIKVLTGQTFKDPADLAGGSGTGNVMIAYFGLPFHGGPGGGILGAREELDFVQPCDRMKKGSMEIVWSGAAIGTNQGTITAGTLYTSVDMVALPQPVQGADFRVDYTIHANAQTIDIPTSGLRTIMLCVCNPDLDHVDFTSLSMPEAQLMDTVLPQFRIQNFNRSCIKYQDQEVFTGAPEVLPLIFMSPRAGLVHSVGLGQGRARLDTTNTHGADIALAFCHIHSRRRLVEQFAQGAATGSLYSAVTKQQVMFSKKNVPGNQFKKKLLAEILPAKLISRMG